MSTQAARQATVAVFPKMKPQMIESGGKAKTWITRGANMVVTTSKMEAGSALTRKNNPDEYMVLIPPDGPAATITAGGETILAQPDSLTIVPPGPSSISAKGKGLIARVFSTQASDLAAKASNKKIYADGAPECAPLVHWPEPVGGFKLRNYPLAQYVKPGGDRIQPRVFRCTNIMVNVFVPYKTPRDTATLSPHWHEDFEQASLTLHGTWVHHLRWPWTADLSEWRADCHDKMATPSVLIIPANVVHTSRNIGKSEATLYDIFVPPRMDFAAKPGFVINEAEYPLPDTGDKAVVTKGTLMNWQKSA